MSAFLTRHGAHVVVLGGPLVLLGGLFLMLHLTRPDRTRVGPSMALILLSLTWAGAASVHLLVIGEHFKEDAVLGLFFLLLCAAQYTYAIALLVRCSPRLLALGLLANSSVMGLWAYTRTLPIPFELGGRESIDAIDLTATILEAVAVMLAALVLNRRTSTVKRTSHPFSASWN